MPGVLRIAILIGGFKVKIVDRITGSVLRVVDYVAMALLMTSVLVLVGNVLLRAVFNAPLFWTLDYVRLIMLCVVSLTLASNERAGGNIIISFFTEMMPPKIENICSICTDFLNIALCAFCTKLIFDIGVTSFHNGDMSDTLNWPIYGFYYVLSFGFALLTIVLVIKLVGRFINHKSLSLRSDLPKDQADDTANSIL